jgi:hypothetical protein
MRGQASEAGESVWILDGALELAAGRIDVAPLGRRMQAGILLSLNWRCAEPDDLVRVGGDAGARIPAGKVS